jgi:hypothetical protein
VWNTYLKNRFHEKFNPDFEKTIIFVDDSKANIEACHQCNMVGVLYFNAQFLRDDLVDVGVQLRDVNNHNNNNNIVSIKNSNSNNNNNNNNNSGNNNKNSNSNDNNNIEINS